ncbi:ATP-dependent endonuclease [Endozoicomonas sp. YOMI1]|uniref:ATP-dependent nuclease n=1 Tax=Endozoicomonas sp. YOMI1 TaxID=2828739 RepID=UPI0021485C33|nr:AAA family ATPase [Endozoicomonas sp. YOMI1]
MGIQIDIIRVSGFRGIRNLEMRLRRVTVLIGTNNSGKTSVIKALQLALGDYARYLSDEDFHIDSRDQTAKKILIDIRIVAADSEGNRIPQFTADWQQEFGDKIQQEADGRQYLAIRTESASDVIKGGYTTNRYALTRWPSFAEWQDEKLSKKNKLSGRMDAVPFIGIEAQRDIHQELKEKTSFVGRVLAGLDYDEKQVAQLEDMVREINELAVKNSEPLSNLKLHLEKLNQSFQGTGKAEITPFPKKIRDLSKQFTVHFGEQEDTSFSMEYHGMGTRSWASMLTVKAFTEMLASKYEEEAEPFFPIMAAEEPEAHLHPNAQRTLYRQLANSNGQVIVSTHSPYLASMADIHDICALANKGEGVVAYSFDFPLDPEDLNALHREVLRCRGEILFSKALVLFEGVTEEQIFPAMFESYYGKSSFECGVNFIGASGKNYAPFIKMACSLGIPVFVVSDNDGSTQVDVSRQISNIKKDTGLELDNSIFSICFLNDGNDIEAELLKTLGLREEIIEALVLTKTKGSENEHFRAAKYRDLSSLTDDDLLKEMRGAKASYAGFFADVISRNPQCREKEGLLPEALKEAFTKIEEWVSL